MKSYQNPPKNHKNFFKDTQNTNFLFHFLKCTFYCNTFTVNFKNVGIVIDNIIA